MEFEEPDALTKAAYNASLSELELDMPRELEQTWGRLTEETLVRLLHQEHAENAREKIFALFALGYLAPAGVEDVLLPFLQSPQRMERWASALALGRLRDERVLPVLQTMLLEGIADPLPVDTEDTRAMDCGDVYMWYNSQRCVIAEILGAWGNLDVVPALRQAITICYRLEHYPGPFEGRWSFYFDSWIKFQDRLAYTLGQLGAFGALVNVELPAPRRRIAMTYALLGYLHITHKGIFIRDVTSKALDFAETQLAAQVLEQQFGLSPEEQALHRTLFPQDCEERIEAMFVSRRGMPGDPSVLQFRTMATGDCL